MRKIFWIYVIAGFFFLIPLNSYALNSIPPSLAYEIDTSSTNLTANYPAGPQLQATTLGGTFSRIDIVNTSTSPIEINCYSTSKPSNGATGSFIVPGSMAYSSPINSQIQLPLGGQCWARSVSGTISSGIFEMVGWQY